MAEENNKPTEQKTEEKKQETKPAEAPKEKPITDTKTEEKKEVKKPEIKDTKPKKTEAVVNAKSLPISTKHSIAICNMIRGKDIDQAISLLEKAETKKIPVPMRGEIPHRKGKGMMSGRYPITALGHFIKTLKSLKSNALVNELELEKYEIFCKANLASRPYRRFGRGKFKRTNLTLKLIPIKIKKKNKTQKKQGENK
tara:strand:- start:374 stop:967 length:594 start_codon:yes stop_codon:yes gene_type:complete